jgi:putative resolvase
MDKTKYFGGKKTCEILGVHMQTLYNWDKSGKIEVIRSTGGKRFYNVNKYLEDNRNENENKKENKIQIKIDKKKICYIRVSTIGQKNDLKRQKEYMKNKYPEHEIIEDIGSGINFNRRGLRKIIDLAIEGKIEEVIVAYKDRLTRFGYELLEDMIDKYSGGKIIVENNKDEKKEAKEELVEDVLQILNVYTAKMNGLRRYK